MATGTRSLRFPARAALWVIGACLWAPAAHAQRPDSVETRSVSFVGAHAFGSEELRSAIATTSTSCLALLPFCWLGLGLDRQYFDPRVLGADVVRLRVLYYQGGYREATVAVDSTRTPDGMRLRFLIHEGRPIVIDSLTFEGREGLPNAITRNLPIAVGQPFSLVHYEAARDSIIARLNNRGYAYADVLLSYFIPRESPYSARIHYHLLPGMHTRFGAITVTGTRQVSPTVVRRMLVFHQGDAYSYDAILRSQRNLFGLEVFRHAEISASPATAADSVLDVHVQVNEGDLYRVRFGAGLSTADMLNAEGRWTSRNFLGGARHLEIRGRVSNLLADRFSRLPGFENAGGIYGRISGSLTADFQQPWIFGPRNTLGTGMFVERRTLPDVYVRTAVGAYLTMSRRVGNTGAITLGYRPEFTRLESEGDLIFCVSFIACGSTEINALRDPHWLAPVSLTLSQDRSNSLFAPTRGYTVRIEAEHAARATGSDFAYDRVLGDVTGYHEPFRRVVVAARLRPGWAHDLGGPEAGLGLHPQKRFFAGGANSVRGFAQYRLGPKLLTVDAARVLARPDSALGWVGCTAQSINDGSCDPALLAARAPGRFDVRPVGGAASLEGNIEVRFPVFREKVRGAAFLDFGQVWRTPHDVSLRTVAWTPGLGIRYFSAVGPIRIDIGYNGGGAEGVTVFTTEVQARTADGTEPIQEGKVYSYQQLENLKTLRPLNEVSWNPYRHWDPATGTWHTSFTDRLQLHFSIGQAF